jgi:hypothetical protein
MINNIHKIIKSNKKMIELFDLLMEKNQRVWFKFKGSDEVFEWLNNFSNKDEMYLALILANNITYYTSDQIKYLWKLILTNKVKKYVLENFFSGDLNIMEDFFSNFIKNECVFIGYGLASKSGPVMAYFFRQSRSKYKLKFMERHEFLYSSEDFSKKKIIFVLDDFIGSGNQASHSWFSKGKKNDEISFNDICKKYPNLKFIYLVLVGVDNGKKYIESHTPLKVILGEELDQRSRCFSEKSIVYPEKKERARAKIIMEKKGRKLCTDPLGYNNMQLAVAFNHNTPDNTLPVIWKRLENEECWIPLFERFE